MKRVIYLVVIIMLSIMMGSDSMADIQTIPVSEDISISNEKINNNFTKINAQIINHIAGNTDKHTGTAVTLNTTGKTKITANNLQGAIDQIEDEVKGFVEVNANAEVADAHISTAKSKTFADIRERFEETERDVISQQSENESTLMPINNEKKSARNIQITADSESGHYSSYSHTKLYDGLMTVDTAGNGWLVAKSTGGWVKFKMPVGVVIGDSIAEGHPSTHGRLHTSTGTVDLNKANELGQQSFYYEQFAKIKVYNHGIGGERADQIRVRWNRDVLAQTDLALTPTSTLPKKPAFVVIVCGINDVWAGRTSADIQADIEWMIDSAVSNGIYPIVFTIGPHNLMDANKLVTVKEVNAWLVSKSKSTPTMKLFDYYTYANDPNNDGKPKAGIFIDDVHPTKITYQNIARQVIEEAFVEPFPAVVPRFINISTAIDSTNTPGTLSRPVSILLYVNDKPKHYFRLPNNPDAVIPIPYNDTYIDTIKIEIINGAIPTEYPSSLNTYYYLSQIYVTDRNEFTEIDSINPYKGDESNIIEVSTVSGIAAYYPAISSPTTPGQFTFTNTADATNVVGVYVAATGDTGFMCIKGLCSVVVNTEVYEGDLVAVAGTGNRVKRVTSPIAGSVIGKVVVGQTTIGGNALINIIR